MKLIEKYKLLFVHIPKTAGTTITNAFGDELSVVGEVHEKARDTKRLFNDWDKYEKFTIIRNPWDLQVSNFLYMCQKTRHPSHVDASLCGLMNIIWNGQWKIEDYIFDEDTGEILVDNILRFENLDDDWKKFCKEKGIVDKAITNYPSNKKYNSVEHRHYSEYYNKKWMINSVANEHRKYIEYFGYKFETE